MANKSIKDRLRHWAVPYFLVNARKVIKRYQVIFLDYPVHPEPRWGYGKPPHPEIAEMLARGRERYRRLLEAWAALKPALVKIPYSEDTRFSDPLGAYWQTNWLPGLDAVALYGFLTARKAKRYVEVGSGHSTMWAARAIRDQGLATQITSIDPRPRYKIDQLCEAVVRQPLEQVDPAFFQQLEAGDILYIDGSHRVFTNSDVAVFFLEVLPRLKPGVLVELHDIALPYDYPPDWADFYFSEQYMLAASLLAGAKGYEVVFPAAYVGTDPELSAILKPIWETPGLKGVVRGGYSFWIETR